MKRKLKIKTTQPISMILVLFFSKNNVLSDEIKKHLYFRISKQRKSTVPIFGTPGIVPLLSTYISISLLLMSIIITLSFSSFRVFVISLSTFTPFTSRALIHHKPCQVTRFCSIYKESLFQHLMCQSILCNFHSLIYQVGYIFLY